MENGRVIKNCRMCRREKLYQFLDLGFAPPSDALLSLDDLSEPEVLFPLRVLQCEDCGLTQLGYAVDPTLLYGKKYKYESSITKTGKEHFFSMADSICQKLSLPKDSFVVDMGSNVGVLLEGFKNNGMRVLGIDPAPHIVKIANERGIETWQDFFNLETAKKIKQGKGLAKIVTGTNVFAHIDDKDSLVKGLQELLDKDGIFVFEAPYLVDLIENLEYDTIYLEHLEYISVKPLLPFFQKYDMEVFDIEKYDIHGKSVRVFICRKGSMSISDNVTHFLKIEEETGVYKKEVLDNFAKKVALHKGKLVNLLRDLKKEGKRVVGISAPAKGNTILNYCKIGTELIDYMTEKSVIKRGCYTPGMHIPIIGEEDVTDVPDYGIIFAWNFAEEIMKNNKDFHEKGGKFIVPIPEPIIK